MSFAISVDVGGTHIKSALVSESGEIQNFFRTNSKAFHGKEKILENLKQVIREQLSYSKEHNLTILGIAIGSPGIIDPKNKILINKAENLKGWNNISFTDEVEKHFGIKVFVENDAKLAARGEVTFNTVHKNKVVSFITLGTGIGSAIIDNGSIFYGSSFLAGEVGHMVVDPKGPICFCGNKGCWERLVSSKALKEQYWNSFNKKLSSRAILSRIFDKDITQSELHFKNQYLFYLSLGIYNLNQVLNPDYFVLGGGLPDCHEHYVDELIQFSKKKFSLGNEKIIKSKYGNNAALMGGAALVFEK